MNTEKNKNKIIIISSPSGAGKTTICKYLLKKMPNIDLSISYTTRKKRITEVEGKDYFFINQKKFMNLKKNNFFLETAKNFDNYYGSPYFDINKKHNIKNYILFDIDWQGANKLRKRFKKEQILDFFILPPNKNELKRRLERRGSDDNEQIKIRLSHALLEMQHYTDYKYVLINDNILETIKNLLSIINFNLFIDNINLNVKKKLNIIINK